MNLLGFPPCSSVAGPARLTGRSVVARPENLHPAGGDSVQFSGRFRDVVMKRDSNQQIKRMQKILEKVNSYDSTTESLPSRQLRKESDQLRARLHKAMKTTDLRQLDLKNPRIRKRLDRALDDILPEAFALVREAAARFVKKKPYDVQVLAGIGLHQGKVVEMKTGEGKTLSSVLPAYLNALTGLGVHMVTANEYLARRDAQDNAPIFEALGLSVGIIHPPPEIDQNNESAIRNHKRQAYQADITYGTHSEFGFDYLKDHFRITDAQDKVQRGFYHAIVDEADSVLIDDAKTPLILSGESGPQMDNVLMDLYLILARKVERMRGISKVALLELQKKHAKNPGFKKLNKEEQLDKHKEKYHYVFDEGTHEVELTETGLEWIAMEEELNFVSLLDEEKPVFHALLQSIRAKELYTLEKQYLLKDQQIHIVDKSTGRVMDGRTWSDGLHYAIQAKEKRASNDIRLTSETDTFASIPYQSFFRMYPKLSGMTGTAYSSADEFAVVYGLPWVKIPTKIEFESDKPPTNLRQFPDVIARNHEEKFQLVAREIESIRKYGVPVRVSQTRDGKADLQPGEELDTWERELLRRQPILVGTGSIFDSIVLSNLLKKHGIEHQLLNAKNVHEENDIIARAGKMGCVTIATNIAGRGTDIKVKIPKAGELASDILRVTGKMTPENTEPTRYQNEFRKMQRKLYDSITPEMVDAYGLYVIGTERFHSRRVDEQLAGRTGRQGAPGYYRFFSCQDDWLYQAHKADPNIAAVEKKAPGQGADIDKRLGMVQEQVELKDAKERVKMLRYDIIMDIYRKITYQDRNDILTADTWEEMETYLSKQIEDMLKRVIPMLQPVAEELVELFNEPRLRKPLGKEEYDAIVRPMRERFAEIIDTTDYRPPGMAAIREMPKEILFTLCLSTSLPARMLAFEKNGLFAKRRLLKDLRQSYLDEAKSAWHQLGSTLAPQVFRAQLLEKLDDSWRQFLQEANDLRDGINWQVHGLQNADPAVHFNLQSSQVFSNMRIAMANDAIITARTAVAEVKRMKKLAAEAQQATETMQATETNQESAAQEPSPEV